MSNNKFSQFSQLYELRCSIEQVCLARHLGAMARQICWFFGQMCWFFGVLFGERIGERVDTCVSVGICVHLCVDLPAFVLLLFLWRELVKVKFCEKGTKVYHGITVMVKCRDKEWLYWGGLACFYSGRTNIISLEKVFVPVPKCLKTSFRVEDRHFRILLGGLGGVDLPVIKIDHTWSITV